jgi:Activator of Hsp90 ATPase homolog 1-like protein
MQAPGPTHRGSSGPGPRSSTRRSWTRRSRRLAPSGRDDGRDPRIRRAGRRRISDGLHYPPDERAFRGKTSDREDKVNARFVELTPPRRIVEAVNFVTTDPAFFGEMTLIATFEEVPGGTKVMLMCKNLPPGLRAEDNEAGSRLSLEQLARRFEASA